MKNPKKPYLSVNWKDAFKLVGENESEFLSDFCLFRAGDNLWHCIGIGGQGHIQDSFFHAVGKSLHTHMPYTKRVYSGCSAMEWMWAPFAIRAKERGYLYYCHREGAVPNFVCWRQTGIVQRFGKKVKFFALKREILHFDRKTIVILVFFLMNKLENI